MRGKHKAKNFLREIQEKMQSKYLSIYFLFFSMFSQGSFDPMYVDTSPVPATHALDSSN